MTNSNAANTATGGALHPVHSVYDGLFNTATGKTISFNNPNPESIVLEEIAATLGKICRFGGHVQHFYSVAQHSLLVAELAPPHLKKEALLHDAAEAYLGDVIKPLKVMLGGYDVLEAVFMDVIIEKFQLLPENLKAIKPYDYLACELEHEWLQKGTKTPEYEGSLLYAHLSPYLSADVFTTALKQYFK